MTNKLAWPIAISATALFAGIFAWANFGGIVRSAIIFLFMLLVPGLAYTRLVHIRDFLVEIIIAVAISLVLGTILAESMVFLHIWSPNAGLGALIVLSLLGAYLQARQGRSPMRESEL